MPALATSNPACASRAFAARSGLPGRSSRALPVAARSTGSSASAPADAHDEASGLQRRQLLSAALLAPAAASLLQLPARAEEGAAAPSSSSSSSFTYTDEQDQFSITVPAGWVQGSGAIGQEGTLTTQQARFSNAAGLRRVVAFVPENNPSVNVAITIQFLAADFTKMGSLGTAQDFATGVVNRMDNSYILRLPEWRRAKEGPVQVATLRDAREVNGQFVFSYTLAKEGEPERTVYQAVAIGDPGRYHKLFTLNATCVGADRAKFEPIIEDIIKSFRPPPAAIV